MGRHRRHLLTTPSVSDGGRVPTVAVKTVDVWRHFVHKRWNPETQFLNLEVSSTSVERRRLEGNVVVCSTVYGGRSGAFEARAFATRCTRIDSSGSFGHFQARFESQTTGEFGCLIMSHRSIDCLQVQTVSLANNKIGSGQLLSTLAHYLPKLVNLSLLNNDLKVWRDIDYLSGRKGKLEHLRELILIGNPLRELEVKHGRGDKYKR